jgi:rhodanese-related sulfurtransferase
MTVQSVSTTMLAQLSPLDGLGSSGLQQAALLAQREWLPRSLKTQTFPWQHKITYLLKGELMLEYPGQGRKVFVGGAGDALSPLERAGEVPARTRVITDAELLWFEERALDILVTWDQVLPFGAAGLTRKTGATAGLSGMLDIRKLTQGVFSSLPAAHIESLLACFTRQPVRAGDVIVRQDDPGDSYYVIERGRARVTREVAGAMIELAELQAGDVFGEEALIAETRRNATVTMQTDGELLRLEGADFIRLLRAPLLRHIDADAALRRVAHGAQWIDVRFPAEYRCDGLPGAVNIPLNELRDALPSLHKDRSYIVYCQTGRRSSAAAFLLSQRGFDASLLEGGLKSMIAMENIEA